jgi:hypothetical protein
MKLNCSNDEFDVDGFRLNPKADVTDLKFHGRVKLIYYDIVAYFGPSPELWIFQDFEGNEVFAIIPNEKNDQKCELTEFDIKSNKDEELDWFHDWLIDNVCSDSLVETMSQEDLEQWNYHLANDVDDLGLNVSYQLLESNLFYKKTRKACRDSEYLSLLGKIGKFFARNREDSKEKDLRELDPVIGELGIILKEIYEKCAAKKYVTNRNLMEEISDDIETYGIRNFNLKNDYVFRSQAENGLSCAGCDVNHPRKGDENLSRIWPLCFKDLDEEFKKMMERKGLIVREEIFDAYGVDDPHVDYTLPITMIFGDKVYDSKSLACKIPLSRGGEVPAKVKCYIAEHKINH